MTDNVNLGDVAIETSFADYQDVERPEAAGASDDEDRQMHRPRTSA